MSVITQNPTTHANNIGYFSVKFSQAEYQAIKFVVTYVSNSPKIMAKKQELKTEIASKKILRATHQREKAIHKIAQAQNRMHQPPSTVGTPTKPNTASVATIVPTTRPAYTATSSQALKALKAPPVSVAMSVTAFNENASKQEKKDLDALRAYNLGRVTSFVNEDKLPAEAVQIFENMDHYTLNFSSELQKIMPKNHDKKEDELKFFEKLMEFEDKKCAVIKGPDATTKEFLDSYGELYSKVLESQCKTAAPHAKQATEYKNLVVKENEKIGQVKAAVDDNFNEYWNQLLPRDNFISHPLVVREIEDLRTKLDELITKANSLVDLAKATEEQAQTASKDGNRRKTAKAASNNIQTYRDIAKIYHQVVETFKEGNEKIQKMQKLPNPTIVRNEALANAKAKNEKQERENKAEEERRNIARSDFQDNSLKRDINNARKEL